MLELQGIRFQQDDFTLHADLTVSTGRCVAVIGPSGAGKSTLLSIIAGFERPQSGRVLWDGRDLTPMPPGRRPVSMIFQDNNLFPHLTVEQNVGLGLSPTLRLGPAERRRVAEVLDMAGLSGLGGRKPSDLSGGQQSRVALARTLVRDRPLVLLDEPFSALGPALKDAMLDLMVEVTAKARMTVLFVTHDPGDARRVAEETVFVEAGTVNAPVPTTGLFRDPPPGLKAYLGM